MKGDTHKVYPWDAMNKMDENGLIQILRKSQLFIVFLYQNMMVLDGHPEADF